MPKPISIECTHCGAKLKLVDASKLGKKLRCPKCSEVFVASQDDDLDLDEIEVMEDDEEEDYRPRGKKSSSAGLSKKSTPRGKKKGKKKKSGGALPWIIGGSVGGVALVGGTIGLLFALGVFGGASKSKPQQVATTSEPAPAETKPSENPPPTQSAPPPTTPPQAAATNNQFVAPAPLDQKWLPPNAEVIIRVRVAELWNAPLLKGLTTGPQAEQMIATMKQYTGLEPDQIDIVTVVLSDVQNWMINTQLALGSASPDQPKSQPPSLVVIETKQPADPETFTQATGATQQSHQGKSYYELPPLPQVPETVAVYWADPRTVLVTEVAELKQAIERGPNSKSRPELNSLDASQHFLLAGVPVAVDPQLLDRLNEQGSMHPAVMTQARQFSEQLHCVSLGLKISGGIDAQIALDCKSPQTFQELKGLIEEQLQAGLAEYQTHKAEIPPFLAEISDLLVNNLQRGEQGQVWQVRTSIPDSAQDKLTQLPAALMLMAATSGLQPPAGAGGGLGQLFNPFGGGASPMGNDADANPFGGSPGDRPMTQATNVAAAPMKDLPKGFELNGALSDGYHPVEATERALAFSLDLSDLGSKQPIIAAAGKLQPGEVTTRSGEKIPLKPEAFAALMGISPYEPFLNAEGENFFSATMGAYSFAIPKDETEPLQSLSGSFSYLTGKKGKLVKIKDLRKQVGKPPADAALKAAGLKLELAKKDEGFGEAEILTISVKKGYLLSKIQAINTKGELDYTAFPGIGPNEQTQILKPGVGTTVLTDGVGVQAYLYSDVKEVEVPFTFENIALPKIATPDNAPQNGQ